MHLAGVVDEIADKMGFIDEVTIFVDEFLEIGDALFQLFHDAFQHSMVWLLYLYGVEGVCFSRRHGGHGGGGSNGRGAFMGRFLTGLGGWGKGKL